VRAANPAKVDPSAERDDDAVATVTKQIAEYCAGTRRAFEFELAADGPAFQHEVWDALVKIPFGTTTS
jgi:methylated-DNA-[protein]-cysteine S-methyltransferase